MGETINILKCGVRFEPPAVMLTYMDRKSQKLRQRTMPLRNFTKNTSVDRIVTDLRNNTRHRKYINSLSLVQLQRLVTVIKDHLNGISLEDSLARNRAMESIDPEEDLCKVDDETLKRKKLMMDQSFEKNRKKPGDPDFMYNVEVDFDTQIPLESSGWDSPQEGSDEDF